MTSLLRTFCAAALLGGALAALPASAAVVSLSGPSNVGTGSTFQIDVNATGFTDLYAYQFDISFDRALFGATGVTEGDFLAGVGSTFFDGGVIDDVGGTISFVFDSLIGPGPGASGSGAGCQDTGWLSRSHLKLCSRSSYGRAQNSSVLRLMSGWVVLFIGFYPCGP